MNTAIHGNARRSCRTRGLLRGAAGLAALAALALGTPAAYAQTNALVSTLTTPPASTAWLQFPDDRIGQAFRTDGNNYEIHSVVLDLPYDNQDLAVLTLHADDAGTVGASVAGFDTPAGPFIGNRYRFLPSSPPLAIDRNTTYWLVLTAPSLPSDGSLFVDWTFLPSPSPTGPGSIPADPATALFPDPDTLDPVWHYYPLTDGAQMFAVYFTDGTAVDLIDFSAAWTGEAARISWRTGAEIDNAGFNVWRSDSETGEYAPVNAGLIPAEGGAAQGAAYSLEDRTAAAGAAYWYKLEDVSTSGERTFHPPILALMGRIALLEPAASATLRTRSRFTWDGGPCETFQVQFSKTADFPAATTLSLPGSASGFTPTPLQWRRISRIGGVNGRLFWRVVGGDDSGATLTSAARALRILR